MLEKCPDDIGNGTLLNVVFQGKVIHCSVYRLALKFRFITDRHGVLCIIRRKNDQKNKGVNINYFMLRKCTF